MLYLLLYLFFLFSALGAGFLSAISDISGMKIPNVMSVIIILSFIGAYVVGAFAGISEDVFFDVWKHVLSGIIMFAITYVLFLFNIIGGGDSKLATAYGFWLGLSGLSAFLFYMTMVGGVVAVVSILIAKFKPFKTVKEGSWIARSQAGESVVPYGIAIFLGAVISFIYLGYFNKEVFELFLL